MSTVVLHAKSHKPKESTAIQPMRDEKRTTSRWWPNNLRLTLSKDFRSRATQKDLFAAHPGRAGGARMRSTSAHAQHPQAAPPSPRRLDLHPGPTLLAPAGVSPGWLAAGCFRCSSVRRAGGWAGEYTGRAWKGSRAGARLFVAPTGGLYAETGTRGGWGSREPPTWLVVLFGTGLSWPLLFGNLLLTLVTNS